MSTSTAVCITGMHRSGTSLVASWLELCGVAIHNGQMYGPDVGNPRGHFEDAEFAALHAKVLRNRVRESHGWKVDRPQALAFSDDQRQQAAQLIASRNRQFELWGWKDPRSVLFLKEWKNLLPTMKAILIWRPCLEVVASLTERGRKSGKAAYETGPAKAARIWVTYNQSICEYKQLYPKDTLLLPLPYIIANDRQVIGLVEKQWAIKLRYNPIAAVLEEPLLRRRNQPHYVRLAAWWYGVRRIEQRLLDLSDAK